MGIFFSGGKNDNCDTQPEGSDRMEKTSMFRMEAAGDLTPELDGAPCSGAHPHRTKEKGRGTKNEARQEEAQAFSLEKGMAKRRHE